jgi:hypothetical protein
MHDFGLKSLIYARKGTSVRYLPDFMVLTMLFCQISDRCSSLSRFYRLLDEIADLYSFSSRFPPTR